MKKWVKILLSIIGVSTSMTFFSLYLLETTIPQWQTNGFLLTEHPYGIMLLVFGGIFVISCGVGILIFSAMDEEGGY